MSEILAGCVILCWLFVARNSQKRYGIGIFESLMLGFVETLIGVALLSAFLALVGVLLGVGVHYGS